MWRVLCRDIGSQFCVSRNLNEGLWLKLWRALWATVYLLKGLRCACRAVFHEQCGSDVVYEGRRCRISNWAGSASPTLAGDGFYLEHADRSKIRNVITLAELYHRWEFGLSFYMSCHHGLDVNRRLYPAIYAKDWP